MNSPATNQRRRSLRNRQPTTPANHRPRIVFEPKLKYANSSRTADGVLILSKRKRTPPTEAEKERKKQRKIAIKAKQVALVSLRHKIITIYEHGIHTADFQFGPKQAPKIIEFLQATNPHYAAKAAAKSFVYRAIKRQQSAHVTPHLDPFRDCRGENRTSPKRKNPEIVTLVDELLSEPKSTVNCSEGSTFTFTAWTPSCETDNSSHCSRSMFPVDKAVVHGHPYTCTKTEEEIILPRVVKVDS